MNALRMIPGVVKNNKSRKVAQLFGTKPKMRKRTLILSQEAYCLIHVCKAIMRHMLRNNIFFVTALVYYIIIKGPSFSVFLKTNRRALGTRKRLPFPVLIPKLSLPIKRFFQNSLLARAKSIALRMVPQEDAITLCLRTIWND